MRSLKETDIQRQILTYLRLRGIFAWRSNNIGVPTPNGFRPSPVKGLPDILGVLPGGKFLALEVKQVGGRVSEHQKTFLEAIRKQGGVAEVVHSLEETKQVLIKAGFDRIEQPISTMNAEERFREVLRGNHAANG